jgi:hypothetical protein
MALIAPFDVLSGRFKSQGEAKPGESVFGMSSKMAHGLTAVVEVQAIQQSKDGAVEHLQDEDGGFSGELQTVFAQGGIATPVAGDRRESP